MTEMSFLEHLQELRTRLIVIIVAMFLGMAVAWPFTEKVQRFIQRPLREPSLVQKWNYALSSYVHRTFPKFSHLLGLDPQPPQVTPHKLNYMAPLEPFFVQMKISLVTGLALAFPVILYQLWLFISPGLFPHERRYIYYFIPFGTLAFVAGDLFFLYLVWPLIIAFSLAYESDVLFSMLNLTQYVNFCLRLMLLFGVIFELPLILLLLNRARLVSLDFLVRNRRLAILLSAVIAAFHADVVTMTVVAVPIYCMYEVSILLLRLAGRKPDPAAAAEPAPAPLESGPAGPPE
ncbi:MAG: twin-arginine translocase subunit TatC [Deltaproteobacteria bacterium]|nr:twin-arginine translocase subunit TatC [Deltaproteobacteria bacterium]